MSQRWTALLPHAFHKRARPRAYERERRTPTPARINARARTRAGDCAGDADLLLALRDAAVRHNRWQPGPQPAETAARCPFSLLLRRTPRDVLASAAACGGRAASMASAGGGGTYLLQKVGICGGRRHLRGGGAGAPALGPRPPPPRRLRPPARVGQGPARLAALRHRLSGLSAAGAAAGSESLQPPPACSSATQ